MGGGTPRLTIISARKGFPVAAFGKNVLVDLVAALERLPAEVVVSTTETFIRIAEQEAGRARMGTVMGRYPLTATLKSVSVGTSESTMTFLGTPVGFWVWAEEGTRAHTIRPKVRTRSEKGLYRAAMGGGLAGPRQEVRHPGMNGRAAWTHACDRMDDEMGTVIDDAAMNLDLWG